MLFRTMKKTLLFVLILSMMAAVPTMAEEATIEIQPDNVQMSVNGTYIDAPDYAKDGVTFAPLRAVCEAFGYQVTWNEDRSIDLNTTVTEEPKFNKTEYQPSVLPAEPTTVTGHLNELIIRLNGTEILVPNFLYNGTTFVPTSFFATAMNCHVFEGKSLGILKIYSPDYVTFTETDAFYYDGQMLNNEQYQDAAKLLSYLMGGADVTPQIAEQELLYFRAGYLMGEKIAGDENFPTFLEENNIAVLMDQLDISDQEVLLDTFLKAIYYQYAVTDEAALAYYTPTEEDLTKQIEKSQYGSGHWMKAKHILISQTDGENDLKQAEDILKQLKENPKKFDELMNEYSQDPGSKTYPDGYLFTNGQMVTPFYEGALALETGEISGIVESQYGYHIILKVADYPDGVPYTEVQDELHLAYAQEQFTKEWHTALANVNLIPKTASEQ